LGVSLAEAWGALQNAFIDGEVQKQKEIVRWVEAGGGH